MPTHMQETPRSRVSILRFLGGFDLSRGPWNPLRACDQPKVFIRARLVSIKSLLIVDPALSHTVFFTNFELKN